MISSLRWRAFGSPADLDIDFAGAPRNAVVTHLLAACRAEPSLPLQEGVAQAEDLTLAGRIGALAALVARTSGDAALTVVLRCAHADCRDSFEAEVPLGWVLSQADAAEAARYRGVHLRDGRTVALRLPTGSDQRGWQDCTYADAQEAERAILRSLLDSPLDVGDDDLVGQVAAEMEAADPLSALRLHSRCPACDREGEFAADLEAVLLTELRRRQRALLRDVHRLATRYGWSERAIAALPAWRRRAYLQLLEAEEPS